MPTVVELSDEVLGMSKEEQSRVLDEELDKFSAYMGNISDVRASGPLSQKERMIVKTYLIWRIKSE